MGFHRLVYSLILILLTVSCGPGSGKNPHGEDDPLAQLIPDWVNISYTVNGQVQTLTPPFLTTQNIAADAATGSCTGNNIEIIFNGTYNPDKVSKVELTGLTVTSNVSAGEFTFKACMAPGSASVTVTAYDQDNKPVRLPLTVSINAMTATRTLGYGHPRYPNTGFNVAAAGKNSVNGTVVLETIAKKQTTSTGNTGYTLETGFVNYMHEASP